MYWHEGDGWGAGSWTVMILMMVALWAIVVVGIAALLRGWLGRPGPERDGRGPAARSAEEILGERLARGEIDADEYRARLAALHAGSSGGT